MDTLKMNIKMLAIYTLMVVVITVLAVDSCHECPVDRVVDTVTVVDRDTVCKQVADTMPKELKPEKVVGKVTVPTIPDMSDGEAGKPQAADTAQSDGIQINVVQRTFSDDSTYTAYVSGVQLDRYPTLDSIAVQQRTIYKNIERTITIERRRPLSVGLQVGAGVGIITRQPDIFVGIGISYSF